ncbi:hypothetical protein PMZ80_002804 [Knufia obscura]|uniref:Swi5-dependent recombination DNA repair protein 1 homolog n=1 Tax=Knufia obscura TaxID=1635080 RepID=A0ABR0RYD4_9EURO|nr:hypothetical protein PMZ80_002804 [Knufia obscura]
MNPAKRRRLDATASTLSKPFRSPLKVIPNHQAAIPNEKNDHADNQATTPCQALPATDAPTKLPTSSPTKHPDEEVDITELQKEYSALSQQLRKLRQDLDAVEQAHKIQSTNQEEKLNRLILKWRDVARDAADEVFESASSRVKDMGGLQAWQKNSMINSSQDRFSDWFDNKEEQPSSDPVDGFEESANNHFQESSTLNEGDLAKEEEVSCSSNTCRNNRLLTNPQQSFTMDVMLQQLNIDPDLLGFDTKNEQWSS